MKVSVIIPMYNSNSTIEECLQALLISNHPDFQIIVVDDSSTDGCSGIVNKYPVSVIHLNGGPAGPANARNQGVENSDGEILFFIDSDVKVYPDTISRIVQAFEKDDAIAAVFGSYDENPSHRDFISQYKNLVHHFTHQVSVEQAETFWCGCGAVKRGIFQEIGGFDSKRYPLPSIEDIDFGYRLKNAGFQIRLLKDIQVKHLKRWSFKSLIKTDIFNRAVPWTDLILRQRNLPNTLNLSSSHRLATIILLLMLVHLGLFIYQPNLLILPMLIVLFILCAASWSWNAGTPQFKMTPDLEKLILGMIAAIWVVTLWNGQPKLIAPFVIFLPLFLFAQLFIGAHIVLRYILYVLMTLVVGVAFILLLASYPLLLTIPLLVYTLIIILLNQRLYRFFLQKRGILFAIAVLPMQLLYYFYSFVTFVIVTLIRSWNVRSNRKQSS